MAKPSARQKVKACTRLGVGNVDIAVVCEPRCSAFPACWKRITCLVHEHGGGSLDEHGFRRGWHVLAGFKRTPQTPDLHTRRFMSNRVYETII